MILRPHKTMSGRSGQALLISVGILLLLVVSIPVIVFVTQSNITHQTSTQKQAEGRAIAEQGIAYAAQKFAANQTEWALGVQLGGNFTALIDKVGICTGTTIALANTQFKITCGGKSVYPQLQPYQLLVTATAIIPGPGGQLVPGASLQTILSQKTMGASLASGLRASAALSLVQPPLALPFASNLIVNWGPIVLYDTTAPPALSWKLYGNLDIANGVQGFPRKFSNNRIEGTTPIGAPLFPRAKLPLVGPTPTSSYSDNREYWAFASLASPPIINESSYTLVAAAETGLPIGVVTCAGTCPATLGDGSGIFDAGGPGGTATFGPGFTVPAPPNSTIIFVHGDAVIDNVQFDLGPAGAFICTGKLTLITPTGGFPLTLNIPLTAPQEYPYWPPPPTGGWPCEANYVAAVTATPATIPTCILPVNLHGFFWAKGGLDVNNPTTTLPWVVAGAIQVGDPLTDRNSIITSTLGTGSLTLYYDATVNQNIVTVAH